MPDRGDERGRGGTRTLVTGILAGTEWHPATNPQEATQTAREARDLAVRLRPVLSKLAQAPRGGRRRDLEWLPAVEQLAVDAQYFASWWLPRLEGKSAQSWPSWSADGYADWVKRLDAQRLRTLEMVEGTAPVTRIASVTQLRRGKGAATDAEVEEAPAPSVEEPVETHSPARHARDDSAQAERLDEEHTARITPLRGPGAALMDAALMDMAGAPGSLDAPSTHDAPGMRAEEPEPSMSADETHIAKATPKPKPTPIPADGGTPAGAGTGVASAGTFAESTAPTTPEPVAPVADVPAAGVRDELPPVPRTPPNQGPGTGAITVTVSDDPDTTRIQRPPVDSTPRGFDDIAAAASDAALPRVPRTPPNQGPADAEANAGADTGADTGVGADILQIPRTPPNSGPAEADRPRGSRAPVVSLVGDAEPPRVPRTPPNPGPAGGGRAAESDADSTHVSLAPVGLVGPVGPAALGTGAEELTRPLFRPDPPAPKSAPMSAPKSGPGPGSGPGRASGSESSRSSGASVPAAAALAGAAMGAAAIGSGRSVGSGGPSGPSGPVGSSRSGDSGAFGDSGRDEFENFQPGDDLPPPVFPMTEPVEPVDRGRIVRYALAAVVAAAACVVVFVAAHKSSTAKAAPPATSSSSSSAAGSSDSSSSAALGAVTAPTATGTPAPSSTASKPAPPKSSPPPSTAPKTTSPASHTSAAPPPPPQTTTHQAPPPAAAGVSSLSVSSLTPDQTGSYNYTAHVHVTTNGTGSVTVTVTFAGTASQNSPGSIGAQSQSFTLSGKTSYDIAPQLDVHGMCPSSPYIDAVASASGAGSSAAYASSPC